MRGHKYAFGLIIVGVLFAGVALAQYLPGQIKLTSWANPFGIATQGPGPTSTFMLASGGTFTCTSSGTITITNANVDAASAVVITLKTANSPAALTIATITPGTGFTVTCGSGDTSVYNYAVLM